MCKYTCKCIRKATRLKACQVKWACVNTHVKPNNKHVNKCISKVTQCVNVY